MSCPNFWTSLVLKSILEECGVLVQPAQDKVFLTLTVPGPLDAIKTAADELQSKYPHSSPIHIEGLEPVPATPPSTNGAHADPPPIVGPAALRLHHGLGQRVQAARVPGGTKCAIHTSTREDWHRELPQL